MILKVPTFLTSNYEVWLYQAVSLVSDFFHHDIISDEANVQLL